MKIAVLGGAGAMGGLFGGLLAGGGHDVTLLDVWDEGVAAINRQGLTIEDKTGERRAVPVRASTDPAAVGPVDLLLVFVKCYHTEPAVRAAAPLVGPETLVLTLQNGWGNAPRIAAILGEERLLAGLTYHSGVLLGPGHVQHAGRGMTFVGELNGPPGERLKRVADSLSSAGLDVTQTGDVLKEIWSKLALNCCTLPTSAMLRFYSGQLLEHEGTLAVMRGILGEVVAVANAQNIPLDIDERWEAITGVLERSAKGKSSMLQDVEKRRRTEIDVINGAIVEAGQRLGLPTPYNETMVGLIHSLEATFAQPA